MQRVLMNTGGSPAARVALLSANRADAWCAAVAAHISRLATTWLHPLASLEDEIHQIEDCEAEILVIDADAFLKRGGELAANRVDAWCAAVAARRCSSGPSACERSFRSLLDRRSIRPTN